MPADKTIPDEGAVRVSFRAWSKSPAYDNESDGFDTVVVVELLEREIFSCVTIKGVDPERKFWVVTEELQKAVAEIKS